MADDRLAPGGARSSKARRSSPLEPSDLALWNLYYDPGSSPSCAPGDRRFYLNGYVRAAGCDRGEWAFRDGVPVSLGAPVTIHYEDLFARPEPHYVEG